MNFEPKEAAAFLMGYAAAKRKNTPKWLFPHLQTARQVFDGGAFNPLSIYNMRDAALVISLRR